MLCAPRSALVVVAVVAFAATAVAQDAAPPAPLDAPAAEAPPVDAPPVETPAEAADPASDAAPEGDATTAEPAPPDDASSSDDAQPADDGAKKSEAVEGAEKESPMGGAAAFGVAFGTGVGMMGIFHVITIAQQVLTLLGPLLGPAAGFLTPVSQALSALSLFACCVLPGAQGAAMNYVGDTVTGSEPSMAYLWTIIASYASCYTLGCAASLVNLGVTFAVVGAAFFALFTGQGVPVTANAGYILAGSAIGIYGAFALVQPLVPAAVYAMTRDTGDGGHDDVEVEIEDEYNDDGYDVRRRLPRANEVALGAPAATTGMAF